MWFWLKYVPTGKDMEGSLRKTHGEGEGSGWWPGLSNRPTCPVKRPGSGQPTVEARTHLQLPKLRGSTKMLILGAPAGGPSRPISSPACPLCVPCVSPAWEGQHSPQSSLLENLNQQLVVTHRKKNVFYWSIVDLQPCINYCCTAKWCSYTYIYIFFSYPFPLWWLLSSESRYVL